MKHKPRARLGAAPTTKVLTTRAIDNRGKEYKVILELGSQKGVPAWILKVVGTPGEWYMSTLLGEEVPEAIAIRFPDWGILNFSDVMREAVTLI